MQTAIESRTISGSKEEINAEVIAKLFEKFASIWGHAWRSRLKSDDIWEDCERDWLQSLRIFTLQSLRAAVQDSIRKHKDFPPTLGQLIDLCLYHSAVPLECDILQSIIKRDFKHPVSLMCYLKIGSWIASNAKETDLQKKISEAYREVIIIFCDHSQRCWNELEQYKVQKEVPLIPKMPSPEQRLGFKENLAKWMKRAEEEKIKIQNGTIVHPTWPKEKYTMLHGEFDEKIFNERKRYFLSLTDTEALSLPSEDRFDRIRYDSERRSSLGKN